MQSECIDCLMNIKIFCLLKPWQQRINTLVAGWHVIDNELARKADYILLRSSLRLVNAFYTKKKT